MHIELPRRDPKYGDGKSMCKLNKAMYSTCDAPQMCAGMVEQKTVAIGLRAITLLPSVDWHVHVDDLLCSGTVGSCGCSTPSRRSLR